MEETDGEVTHNRTKKTEYIKPEQMTTEKVRLNSVEEVLEDFRNGKIVIVVDDEDLSLIHI